MKFDDIKSETLNLRVSRAFKQALKEAADQEQRSMVNMLEVLLGEYCEGKSIVSAGRKITSSASHKRPTVNRKGHSGASA